MCLLPYWLGRGNINKSTICDICGHRSMLNWRNPAALKLISTLLPRTRIGARRVTRRARPTPCCVPVPAVCSGLCPSNGRCRCRCPPQARTLHLMPDHRATERWFCPLEGRKPERPGSACGERPCVSVVCQRAVSPLAVTKNGWRDCSPCAADHLGFEAKCGAPQDLETDRKHQPVINYII